MTNHNSLSIAQQHMPTLVPFHGTELYLVNHDGQPYTPLRPIVEGMGLDWASQFTKVKTRFKSCVAEITMQLPGDKQRRSVLCFLVRMLPGWLYTINAGKVALSQREKVLQYQSECSEVLWKYWTEGIAVNERVAFPSNAHDQQANQSGLGESKYFKEARAAFWDQVDSSGIDLTLEPAVEQKIVDGFLASMLSNNRWMMFFDHDGRLKLHPVPKDASILDMNELPDRIREAGNMPISQVVPIFEACAQRMINSFGRTNVSSEVH